MNDDDDEQTRIVDYIRTNLKPTPLPQSIEDAISEGNDILAMEENVKTPKKSGAKKKSTSKSNKLKNNPYLIAREDILKNMEEWKRKEIIAMELSGNTDNKFYLSFVKEVATLGDSLS